MDQVDKAEDSCVMMKQQECGDSWSQFLEYARGRCSQTAYENWLAPIQLRALSDEGVTLEVPNVFVQQYLLSNYREDLRAFLPLDGKGEPAIEFVVAPRHKEVAPVATVVAPSPTEEWPAPKLNVRYRFDEFIEGPTNQFVKSAAIGVANQPGRSYNPLVIHGAVGLGKTHLLHSIGHHLRQNHKQLRVQCITTEAFINELVDSLRNKTVDQLKLFYRTDVDVLLVDDIQFLQNRLNFEEEFCNTFEALINQRKQLVITSDKPPGQLKLSERMVARMEWGLVAHIGMPELETRVAILQHKAKSRGLEIPSEIAFSMAEQICGNVRQLEGAVNKLSAYCRLMNLSVTQELVQIALKDLLRPLPQRRVTIDEILKAVAALFEVKVSDLKGACRTKQIAFARQVAMYLACKLIKESLEQLGSSFGKRHSTLLHACKTVKRRLAESDTLRRQLEMVERRIVVS